TKEQPCVNNVYQVLTPIPLEMRFVVHVKKDIILWLVVLRAIHVYQVLNQHVIDSIVLHAK
ncbi:hypothetical protein OFM52_31660, partial [Escherichia coli]|nr:hypothetical protein [Escherichia coli]